MQNNSDMKFGSDLILWVSPLVNYRGVFSTDQNIHDVSQRYYMSKFTLQNYLVTDSILKFNIVFFTALQIVQI